MINRYSAGDYGELEIAYGSQAGVVRDFILVEGGPDVYAVYGCVYDKPESWDIYQADVMKRVKGLTERRYQAAVRFLKKHDFWYTLQKRAVKGQFGAKEVVFNAFPEQFLTDNADSGVAVTLTGLEGVQEGDLEPEREVNGTDNAVHRQCNSRGVGVLHDRDIKNLRDIHEELLTHGSSDDSPAVGISRNRFFDICGEEIGAVDWELFEDLTGKKWKGKNGPVDETRLREILRSSLQ